MGRYLVVAVFGGGGVVVAVVAVIVVRIMCHCYVVRLLVTGGAMCLCIFADCNCVTLIWTNCVIYRILIPHKRAISPLDDLLPDAHIRRRTVLAY